MQAEVWEGCSSLASQASPQCFAAFCQVFSSYFLLFLEPLTSCTRLYYTMKFEKHIPHQTLAERPLVWNAWKCAATRLAEVCTGGRWRILVAGLCGKPLLLFWRKPEVRALHTVLLIQWPYLAATIHVCISHFLRCAGLHIYNRTALSIARPISARVHWAWVGGGEGDEEDGKGEKHCWRSKVEWKIEHWIKSNVFTY